MINLRKDAEAYTDIYGFMQPWTNQSSFNGVLYESQYLLIMNLIGQLGKGDITQWLYTMESILVQPGLIQRTPTYTEQEGPDDYIGYLAALKIANPELAMDVIKYGFKNFGSFNNTTPGKWTFNSFLWRQPQLLAHAYYAAGKRPNFLLRLIWLVTVALAGMNVPVGQTDERILPWLLVKTWNGQGYFSKLAVSIWTKRLFKDYTNGMQDVFKIYFGPDHPLTQYVPKI